MERKQALLKHVMKYEIKAYDIYYIYCQATHKETEIYLSNAEGINALFDDPAEAVYAFYNADINPTEWNFLYYDDCNVLTATDNMESAVDMNALTKWIIELEDEDTLATIIDILQDMEIDYHFEKTIRTSESADTNWDWLLDQKNLIYRILKEDWGDLIKEMEEYE